MVCLLLLAGSAALARPFDRSPRTLDSLQARLRQPGLPDSQRVDVLGLLCWYHWQSDLKASRRYGEQGLALALRARYLKGELTCLRYLSAAALVDQDLVQAQRLAQQLLRRTDAAPPRLAAFQVHALKALGDILSEQEQYEQAARYYRQGKEVMRTLRPVPPNMEATAYADLMTVYSNRLTAYEKTLRAPDSLVRPTTGYARQALRLARRDGAPLIEASALMVLGLAAQYRQQLDSASALMRQALARYREAGSPYYESYVLRVLARNLLRGHQYVEAARLARQAQALAHQIPDVPGEALNLDALAEALAALGDKDGAYRAAVRARQLNDSATALANQAALAQLQVKFDTERKEHQIKALTQRQRLQQAEAIRQRQRLWLLGAGALLLAVGLTVMATLALRLRRSRIELARQNEALAQARATQDRLYAVIGHDLRAPLTGFMGLTDVLRLHQQRPDLPAPDSRQLLGLLGDVGEQAARVTRLLDNLLHWAAAQTGELRPRPEPVSVPELLREVSVLYEPAAQARGIVLEVEGGLSEIAPVRADRNMTLTMLRNLISNALHAAPAQSTITLGAHQPAPGSVALFVRDQGPGLPLAGAERKKTAGRRGGTGLGLPLVHHLAMLQGASFALEPNVGEPGLTATVTLPVEQLVALSS